MHAKLGKFGLAAGVVLFLLAVQVPAKADNVTYTFTGESVLSGTSFSYVSTSGFLAFPTGILTPTTAGHLVYFGSDDGQVTGFEFFDSMELDISSASISVPNVVPIYSLDKIGTQDLAIGTLNIAQTSVPEPSSLALLGVGLVGLFLLSRKSMQLAGNSIST